MSVATAGIDELAQRYRSGERLNIIDVRTPAEFARVHAVDAILVPLDQFNARAVGKLRRNPDAPIYVVCRSGARAAKACERLSEAGVAPAYCVAGGTLAWERAGLPVERGALPFTPPERWVRTMAGLLVLIGLLLAWLVHPISLGLSAFVGAGLIVAGVANCCACARTDAQAN